MLARCCRWNASSSSGDSHHHHPPPYILECAWTIPLSCKARATLLHRYLSLPEEWCIWYLPPLSQYSPFVNTNGVPKIRTSNHITINIRYSTKFRIPWTTTYRLLGLIIPIFLRPLWMISIISRDLLSTTIWPILGSIARIGDGTPEPPPSFRHDIIIKRFFQCIVYEIGYWAVFLYSLTWSMFTISVD